jgi:hypothetical protein
VAFQLLRQDLAIPIRNVKHKDFSSNLDTAASMLEKGGMKDFLPNLAEAIAGGRLPVDGYGFELVDHIWCFTLILLCFSFSALVAWRAQGTRL